MSITRGDDYGQTTRQVTQLTINWVTAITIQ